MPRVLGSTSSVMPQKCCCHKHLLEVTGASNFCCIRKQERHQDLNLIYLVFVFNKHLRQGKAAFQFWMSDNAGASTEMLVLIPPTASGMVPEPQNVRITSVNLHSTLQWDAPRFPRGNLTYTVQSKR